MDPEEAVTMRQSYRQNIQKSKIIIFTSIIFLHRGVGLAK